MRFLSGTRSEKITYVVEAKRPQFDPTTGTRWYTRPLYAEFNKHKFNSEAGARAYGWTEAERKQVEKHLMDHSDWGRADGRGIFMDTSVTVPTSEKELQEAAIARGVIPERKCLFMQDVGDDVVQCDQLISTSSPNEYCDAHMEIVMAATAD